MDGNNNTFAQTPANGNDLHLNPAAQAGLTGGADRKPADWTRILSRLARGNSTGKHWPAGHLRIPHRHQQYCPA